MPLVVTMVVPASRQVIEGAIEGLAAANFAMMHEAHVGGGGFPSLYESGVVYRRELPRKETWQLATDLLKTREGDCEDLAAYRVGELRVGGEPARVAILPTRRGSYHAVVRRSDGTIEDPSRILLDIERQSK